MFSTRLLVFLRQFVLFFYRRKFVLLSFETSFEFLITLFFYGYYLF